ncbi:MAG: sulfurtransferase [Desulfovibrio sp.]|jgi:rhodanese-related sulfurtransferase|nr:sulfurtransferase [Desulfovibrio sp.]
MLQQIRPLLASLLLLCAATAALAAPPPQDTRKHTSLGLYVDAAEAYAMWQKAPDKVTIVDVRTPEEYDFVGHPAMAPNIPSLVWTGVFDAQKKAYPLAENPRFVEMMKARFKPGDAIVLMCRSGHRSAMAAKKLIEAGFTNVYSMVDGFEGDTVADKASPDFGKRSLNGWKNARLPWTNALDEKLVYIPR